jgi:hypothetical protein
MPIDKKKEKMITLRIPLDLLERLQRLQAARVGHVSINQLLVEIIDEACWEKGE